MSSHSEIKAQEADGLINTTATGARHVFWSYMNALYTPLVPHVLPCGSLKMSEPPNGGAVVGPALPDKATPMVPIG